MCLFQYAPADECDESQWILKTETVTTLSSLVKVIKVPWEKEFGVELQKNLYPSITVRIERNELNHGRPPSGLDKAAAVGQFRRQKSLTVKNISNRSRQKLNRRCSFLGGSDGAVVRALTSHQCGPGSVPELQGICGLSLSLVLVLTPRGFSLGTPVPPPPPPSGSSVVGF